MLAKRPIFWYLKILVIYYVFFIIIVIFIAKLSLLLSLRKLHYNTGELSTRVKQLFFTVASTIKRKKK